MTKGGKKSPRLRCTPSAHEAPAKLRNLKKNNSIDHKKHPLQWNPGNLSMVKTTCKIVEVSSAFSASPIVEYKAFASDNWGRKPLKALMTSLLMNNFVSRCYLLFLHG